MGNSCSCLADAPTKGAAPADGPPQTQTQTQTQTPTRTPLLQAGIDGPMYRGCANYAVTLRRGLGVAAMIPYERRVVRVALEELRDDKSTRVFSFRRPPACAAAGLRVSVNYALLKADPAKVVGFACVVVSDGRPTAPHGTVVASGDMRDLALWDDVARSEDAVGRAPAGVCVGDACMHMLPVVPGFVPRGEYAIEFRLTMAPGAAEPVVYVSTAVTALRTRALK